MSVTIQAILIILAIAIFVYLSLRGLSPIVGALIATAIVSFIAIGGFSTNFFTTFINGMAMMFGTFFLLFTCGVAFGGTLSASGAADRIGKSIINALGEKNFIYSIVIITFLIGLTGAPPLALMPGLCFGMMKRANLPRYIAMTAVAGATSISMTCVPGTLGAGNVIASSVLGTNVYAGASIGISAAGAGVILLCIFLNRLINDARKNNVFYDPIAGGMMNGDIRAEKDMPSFFCSILPVFFVLGFVAVLIFAFGTTSLMAAVFSTAGGILLNILMNFKYFKVINIRDCLTSSVNGIQWNIVTALSVIGFAGVIANTTLFTSVVGYFMQSSMDPYILICLSVFIIAALCADCIGGEAAFLNTIGVTMAKAGVHVEVIHRLSNIASSTFDSMPHGGSMILALSMFGYNHKQGYKYLIVTTLSSRRSIRLSV